MDLVTPAIGLVFWTSLALVILYFLLRKFAWKPILAAIEEREQSIEDALERAEKAKQEMGRLNAETELLLQQARIERDKILKEAKHLKEQILQEAKVKALEDSAKTVERARIEIENQKSIALVAIKNQVADLSIQLAERVLGSYLEDKEKQETLVASLLKDIKWS